MCKEMKMDTKTAAMIIVGMCLILLFVLAAKKRGQFLLRFVIRMATCVAVILFCNQILEKEHITSVVGINPTTLLTVGTLGISGVALLYGIVFTKFL